MLSSPSPPPPPQLPPLSPTTTIKDNKTLYCLILTSIVSLTFIFTFSSSSSSSPSSSSTHSSSIPPLHNLIFNNPNNSNPSSSTLSLPDPPSLAYFLTASDGETPRIIRLLFSIYHPRNYYLLHLDLTASQSQRENLSLWVESHPVFGKSGPFHNVYVVGKADFAYPRSPSSISNILHGASLFLRWTHWHWFITLSSNDYPLVTQDDLLHILSYLPKNLNFMNHTSDIDPREAGRMKLITVDPGIYLKKKSEMFYATQLRELPNAFKLFTGSISTILSREFIEFCITGSSNLPRTVLMYLSNVPSSQANYFPTVLCNTQEFKKTIVNYNPHFAILGKPPKLEQGPLGQKDLNTMIKSGAAFGSGFPLDDPVLDDIDQKLLSRKAHSIVPGGWCLGETEGDPCIVWGHTKVLRPGPGATRLERRLVELLSDGTLSSQQCVVQ